MENTLSENALKLAEARQKLELEKAEREAILARKEEAAGKRAGLELSEGEKTMRPTELLEKEIAEPVDQKPEPAPVEEKPGIVVDVKAVQAEEQQRDLLIGIEQKLLIAKRELDQIKKERAERKKRIEQLQKEIRGEKSQEGGSLEEMKEEIREKLGSYDDFNQKNFILTHKPFVHEAAKKIEQIRTDFRESGTNPLKSHIAESLAPRVRELCDLTDERKTDEDVHKISKGNYWNYESIEDYLDNTVRFTLNGFLLQIQNKDEVKKGDTIHVGDEKARHSIVGPDGKTIEKDLGWEDANSRFVDMAKAALPGQLAEYERVKDDPEFQKQKYEKILAEINENLAIVTLPENYTLGRSPEKVSKQEILLGNMLTDFKTVLGKQAGAVKAFPLSIDGLVLHPGPNADSIIVMYKRSAPGKVGTTMEESVSVEIVAQDGQFEKRNERVSYNMWAGPSFKSSMGYGGFPIAAFNGHMQDLISGGKPFDGLKIINGKVEVEFTK